MTNPDIHAQFSTPLLLWFDKHGRKDLPWQTPRDPYRVWVSEIMLQQTQVQTVIAYFNRFIEQLPTLQDLAQAPEDQVLSLWSGLGYYSRARNLHKTAKLLVQDYESVFPKDMALLTQLPGIGQTTAAAILSQAFNLQTAILDGNVKRVLTRFFMIEGHPEKNTVKKQLWDLAQRCMPDHDCANYTQAIMDLGATCCTLKKPNCTHCPLQTHCLALKNQVQDQYPTKKIKKPVPTQRLQFLVLQNDANQIYLEKRPSKGLWGGLWCLPSLELDQCPLAFINQNYQLQGETPQPLIAFKHQFSHFHLHIKALSIKTKSPPQALSSPTGKWFSKEQFSSLGLAKPTFFILGQFFKLSI